MSRGGNCIRNRMCGVGGRSFRGRMDCGLRGLRRTGRGVGNGCGIAFERRRERLCWRRCLSMDIVRRMVSCRRLGRSRFGSRHSSLRKLRSRRLVDSRTNYQHFDGRVRPSHSVLSFFSSPLVFLDALYARIYQIAESDLLSVRPASNVLPVHFCPYSRRAVSGLTMRRRYRRLPLLHARLFGHIVLSEEALAARGTSHSAPPVSVCGTGT